MKKSITQELGYGCGVACFAFACDVTFQQAVKLLGREYSVKFGWKPSDLAKELNKQGFNYKNRYVRKKAVDQAYPDGTIVLIESSREYPVGHYLILYHGKWMDPWINLADDDNLNNATSGFRDWLPGKALVPY